jgi:hypothetical protein
MLMDTNLYVDGGVICNYPLHCFDGRLINIREYEKGLCRGTGNTG